MAASKGAPQFKEILGAEQHQEFFAQPFTVDRTNLFQGKLEQHVFEPMNEPSGDLMSLSHGNAVAAEAGISNLSKGGLKGGPVCVGVERRYDSDKHLGIYTYSYEGIATDHSTRYYEYELEFSMSQEPIETHPSFKDLNNIYGPYDSINRLWPPIITEESAAVGLKAKTTSGPITNPMYGVTSYLSPICVFRRNYTTPDADSDIMDNIGSSFQSPPEIGKAFPGFQKILSMKGQRRNWLKMAPRIIQHGNCLTISEEWMLSGPRGWLDQIYSPDALKGQNI